MDNNRKKGKEILLSLKEGLIELYQLSKEELSKLSDRQYFVIMMLNSIVLSVLSIFTGNLLITAAFLLAAISLGMLALVNKKQDKLYEDVEKNAEVDEVTESDTSD